MSKYQKPKFSWDRTPEEIKEEEETKRKEAERKEAEKQARLEKQEAERIKWRESAKKAAENREIYGYRVVKSSYNDGTIVWEIWTTDGQTEYITANGRAKSEAEMSQAVDAKVNELVEAGKIKDEIIEASKPAPQTTRRVFKVVDVDGETFASTSELVSEQEDTTATREDIEKANNAVFGTSWNPYGANTIQIWQDKDGDMSPNYRNHWYINRQNAYETIRIRVGRTKAEVRQWIAERKKNVTSNVASN